MTDLLFPPVPAEDEVERAAREHALAALRATAEQEAPATRRRGAAPHAGRPPDPGLGAAPHAGRPRDPGLGTPPHAGRLRAAGSRRRLPRPGGARRLRWLLLPAVLAGVAAALVALSPGETLAPPEASAAVLLQRAAAAAERAPAPGALGPGQYLYVRRTAMEPKRFTRAGERFTAFIRYIDEDWTARDGSGRSRHRPAPPSFPTERDRTAWERAGSPGTRELVGNYLPAVDATDSRHGAYRKHAFPARSGGAGLSYRQVRALPGDPAALSARLFAEVGALPEFAEPSRDLVARLRVLERIGRLLSGAPLDAAQRAALFRVAAGLPGVTVSHDALDRLGRRGTAVKLAGDVELDPKRPPFQSLPHRRSVAIVFDPATGALLGTRVTLDAPRAHQDYGAVFSAEVRGAMR